MHIESWRYILAAHEFVRLSQGNNQARWRRAHGGRGDESAAAPKKPSRVPRAHEGMFQRITILS